MKPNQHSDRPSRPHAAVPKRRIKVCEASNAGLVSLQGKPESALFPPAAYRSVTTASEEQSAHTSHLPTTQFLHPSPPHPKARPRLRTRSSSLTAAAAGNPLETRALRLQMSYNFLQRKPTEYRAETVITASQRQPAVALLAPRTVNRTAAQSRPSTPRPPRRQATGFPRPPAPPSPP